ncbi:chemotaxis protein CheX [Aquabacterium sp.]|uniref:chemotaxis protein CheX n=1 Tax=Aquabacterium sp. TaxID=1872578 RepID=UPI002E2FADCB|nr:chemotaxis protein CheX [Aquabacterium sp.]HEX5313242.1 chemotaxis protein CheX [Aquabacterium sp.]
MEQASIVSKVLVIDDGDVATLTEIKRFCAQNNLIGLKTHSDNVMNVLRSNADLGGILLSESYHDTADGGIQMGQEIHALRPELPIFLRRKKSADMSDLTPAHRHSFCAAFTIETIDSLKHDLNDYIFSFVFPNAMVRGIQEITENSLRSQFKHFSLSCDTPYIVKDSIVCGEVFTLIPLESTWCRGYMMLQCDNRTVKLGPECIDPNDPPKPSRIAEVLGEVTNMIWGYFKARYVGDEDQRLISQVQVPMLVKLEERNVSFGSATPQLCFKYTLTDLADQSEPPVNIYQRFVFNLNWNPDGFKELETATTEELVESGELEMF